MLFQAAVVKCCKEWRDTHDQVMIMFRSGLHMTVSVMAGDSETTVTDCDGTHHQLKGRQVTEMVSVL